MIALTLGLTMAIPPHYQVWFFVTRDCPISKRFTPEMKRIMSDYKSWVDFTYVYVDEDGTTKKIQAHQQEYKLTCPFTLDPKHVKAKKLKVKGVPTAVVLTTESQVFYHGRIDDSYGADFKWHPAKSHDLRNALDDLRNNRPVKVKSTKVIGCALNE